MADGGGQRSEGKCNIDIQRSCGCSQVYRPSEKVGNYEGVCSEGFHWRERQFPLVFVTLSVLQSTGMSLSVNSFLSVTTDGNLHYFIFFSSSSILSTAGELVLMVN